MIRIHCMAHSQFRQVDRVCGLVLATLLKWNDDRVFTSLLSALVRKDVPALGERI